MEYNDILNLYKLHIKADKNILISYKGPFDILVLNAIGNYINTYLWSNSRLKKKVFNIFIELSQNISFYSLETMELTVERPTGSGTLFINEYDNYYEIVCTNVINEQRILQFNKFINKINSMDKEQLREFKRKQLMFRNNQHRGNIGLIKIVLLSGNPLIVHIKSIDNGDKLVTLCAKVEKS